MNLATMVPCPATLKRTTMRVRTEREKLAKLAKANDRREARRHFEHTFVNLGKLLTQAADKGKEEYIVNWAPGEYGMTMRELLYKAFDRVGYLVQKRYDHEKNNLVLYIRWLPWSYEEPCWRVKGCCGPARSQSASDASL